MFFENYALNGVYLIKFGKKIDNRGWFQKTYNEDSFHKVGVDHEIKEVYTSLSSANVIRGMHFQEPPKEHAKFISVLNGSIFDVILDLRRSSPTFGKAVSVSLNAEDGATLFLPSGIAHGFLSLENNTLVQYAVTSTYDPIFDKGILWSSLDIAWPINNPILSARDAELPSFSEYESPFI